VGAIEGARDQWIQGNAVSPEAGLPGTIGQIVSVPLILSVRRHFPKIKLCIAEAMSGFVLEWVQDGRVDLAMLYVGVDDRRLQSSPVLAEELRLFCRRRL
jgi:LysR family nitrogen assimilation transcriptional regulator